MYNTHISLKKCAALLFFAILEVFMQKRNVFYYLGDRPFWGVTARLALPIAIQNVLTSSFQLVDTMMVSRLGDVTLSAVGMAGQWGWMASLLSFGLCSGMSVFVSQYWGVGDRKGIRRVLGIAILTGLLLSGIFLAIALLMPETVVRMFNQDPEVVKVGCQYLTIVCFSYPAVMLTNVLSTVLRGTERVKLPMYVSAITTVCNAVVNYALIFGKFGMPELGVSGAAIATCISSWTGPVLLLIFSVFEKNLLIGPLQDLIAFGPANLKKFFQKALPVICNEFLWSLGTVTLNMIYSNQGYEYYAGMTIFRTFADLAFSFYVGLGNSCVIMVGKSIGQGKIERGVQDATRFSFLLPLAGLIVGSSMILFRYQLISIFSTGGNLSALTLQTALAVTIFCSIEVILRNVGYVQVVGVFRSGGDTLRGMIYDVGGLWLIAVPAAFLAANVFHLPFICVVAAAYLSEDIPKALLCLRHFFSMRWIKPVTKSGQDGLTAYRAKYGKP